MILEEVANGDNHQCKVLWVRIELDAVFDINEIEKIVTLGKIPQIGHNEFIHQRHNLLNCCVAHLPCTYQIIILNILI